VEIVERIPIPDELVPADARVEIAAKRATGYFMPLAAVVDYQKHRVKKLRKQGYN
jgi:hypothetical protein